MKLTALGVYGPFPVAGGGCSSYLVEDGDTHILLDCGSGALSRMLRYIPLSKLDAVVLSHMHADHAGEIDLVRYALEFGQGNTPMPVFSPETASLKREAFAPVLTEDGMTATVGSLQLRFFAVRHAAPTTGVLDHCASALRKSRRGRKKERLSSHRSCRRASWSLATK